DQAGKPLANATVRAMSTSYLDGHRNVKTEQTAITNDLGEYRMFWLRPGSYFVSALPYRSDHMFSGVLTTGADPKDLSGLGVDNFAIPGIQGVDVTAAASSIIHKSTGAPAPDEAFVSTYFPNTTDQERASAILVAPGAEVGGTDIAVTPVRTHRIRGIIM